MINLVWHKVVRIPLEQDLRPILAHLQEQNLLHHVTEEEGQQQLWVSDETRVIEVAELVSQYFAGDVELNSKNSATQEKILSPVSPNTLLALISSLPVTIITILLCLIGTILVYLDNQQMSFAIPFLYQGVSNGYFLPLSQSLGDGQYWRLLTPIFLHFGWLHFIFNCIIFWYIGRRIERVKKPLHLLTVVIIVGMISNAAQYLVQDNTVFGGLSGVVYGVIGYIAVYQRVNIHPILQFNESAIIFFIAWLLLGVFGIIDFFISGSIANAAHVSGLVSGAIIGLIVGYSDRSKNPHYKN